MDTSIESKEMDISLQEILDLLPKHIELTYVDYRDNLNDHQELLQECITKQSLDSLYEEVGEWYTDNEWESMSELKKELHNDIERLYEETYEGEIDDTLEKYNDEINDVCWNRDESDVIKDLLRNTSDLVAFYDTGFYVESESWTWTRKEMISERERIKRIFHIDRKNHNYDRRIEIMLSQASYGGRIVVYFLIDDLKEICENSDKNTIQFHNPMIAVIDTFNGSGDNTDLENHTCDFKFLPDNIVLDKTIKYSYTFDVCGMYANWCECTDYKLVSVKKVKRVRQSTVSQEKEREKELDKIYKSGKCSSMDMDMRRHHKKVYINDFPCGTHCLDCGTFWID